MEMITHLKAVYNETTGMIQIQDALSMPIANMVIGYGSPMDTAADFARAPIMAKALVETASYLDGLADSMEQGRKASDPPDSQLQQRVQELRTRAESLRSIASQPVFQRIPY